MTAERTAYTAVLSRTPAFLQDPFAQKEEYKDSWFDKFMVDYFAKQMSKQLEGRSQVPYSILLDITLSVGLVLFMVALKSDHSTSSMQESLTDPAMMALWICPRRL